MEASFVDSLFAPLRTVHIVAGFTALGAGPVAMFSQKGGALHRKAGKVYFWAMAAVALSALGLAAVRSNSFLLLIGIFSFYLSLTGYRALYQKKRLPQQKGATSDLILAGSMLFISGMMIGFSIPRIEDNGLVLLVFGVIGGLLSFQDYQKWRSYPSRFQWVYDHIARMGASYIATLSAFSVVNFTFMPDLVRWLWATAIGTPLIIFTVRRYRLRFEKNQNGSSAFSSESASNL